MTFSSTYLSGVTDWTLSISVSQRAVLLFVSRGCWRDTAWRRGLLYCSICCVLLFLAPALGSSVGCVCVCVCVCVCAGASTGALPEMCPRMGCPSVTGLSWTLLQPSQVTLVYPRVMLAVAAWFVLCVPTSLVCAQKVPCDGPTWTPVPQAAYQQWCSASFSVLTQEPLFAYSLEGYLALLLLWANSGCQTRKHLHYAVVCNHSFFSEIFTHALRRRPSTQISSSLCTVQGMCLPLSQLNTFLNQASANYCVVSVSWVHPEWCTLLPLIYYVYICQITLLEAHL